MLIMLYLHGIRGGYLSCRQNEAGRWTLGNVWAPSNSGAICLGPYPAKPHPISVTRNVRSGLRSAKTKNLSTWIEIRAIDNGRRKSWPLVGMPYVQPTSPSPCPYFAPHFIAVLAAPLPCLPKVLLPKQNTSFGRRSVIRSEVVLFFMFVSVRLLMESVLLQFGNSRKRRPLPP